MTYRPYPRRVNPVEISVLTPSAATTITTDSWAAGAYRKIIVDVDVTGSGFDTFNLVCNADTANNYQDMQQYTQGGAPVGRVADFGTSAFATLTFLSGTANGRTTGGISIDPRVGTKRAGVGAFFSSGAAAANSYLMHTSFAWNDTATGLTSLTFKTGGGAATFTGTIYVVGIPV